MTVGLLGYHFASEKAPVHWLTLLYLVMTVFFSLVAFAAFGLDKRRAGRNGPRIAEGTLHLLSLAGGWPGALIAGRLFRHKTLKASFRILFTLIVLLHVGIVGYLFWLKWNPPATATPAAPATTPA